MSFNYNTAANTLINLELGIYLPGLSSSLGTTATEPPWVQKDIGKSFTETFKYTVPNRNWREIFSGSPSIINTAYLNDCEVGTYITQSQISGKCDINTSTQSVSNAAIIGDYVYFACEDGYLSENEIAGTPPVFNNQTLYRVATWNIAKSICRGYASDEIVWIESPDVSPTGDYKLWYYKISEDKNYSIDNFGATTSFDVRRSLFRREKLVSFTHADLGFIICYVYSMPSDQGIRVYDDRYGNIIDLSFSSLPFIFGLSIPYIKVSPDKKDIFIYSEGGSRLLRFSMGSGPTYSYTFISVGELWDFDFGYSYGGSPSNLYYLTNTGSYSVWDVNKIKSGSYEGLPDYIYDYRKICGTFSIWNTLRWLLCDHKNDPSETCYMFFGSGFVGASGGSNCGAGTMTNIYNAITYSTATYSLDLVGPEQYGWGLTPVIGDYTLGINCMTVIKGPPSISSTVTYAPVGHILQYYNVGNEIRIFNTSRGKVSETVPPTSVSLRSNSSNYDLVRFRDDDVYILVDLDWGQFEIIYWTA